MVISEWAGFVDLETMVRFHAWANCYFIFSYVSVYARFHPSGDIYYGPYYRFCGELPALSDVPARRFFSSFVSLGTAIDMSEHDDGPQTVYLWMRFASNGRFYWVDKKDQSC